MIKEAMFYEKLNDKKVHCFLCSHHCNIAPDKFGICGIRKNKDGKLYTYVYKEVIASHVDPIEKKPLYHFIPGSNSYSIATIGCNFKCSFCQNWQISQVSKRNEDVIGYELSPEEVVREAKKKGIKILALADHNSVGGVQEAIDEGSKIGVRVIPGVEIKARGTEVLGYFVDYKNKELKRLSGVYTDRYLASGNGQCGSPGSHSLTAPCS